ncbi:MAG: ankyrin repeat domain-containing protein [Paenarthrobacter sp.]
MVGAGLLVVGLLSGCTTQAAPPSGAQASSTTSVAPPSSPTPVAPPSSAEASGPASSSAVPSQLSPEAQIETDRLLILAAKANDAARVRELIAAGGNVNAKDDIQDSAFLYAGAEGFNEVLQLTLDAGADVRSTNRYGGTALIPASEHGHTDTVRILIAAGVPVDHVNNLGWTAMQEAILLNNGGPNQQDVVRQLLEAGANPDIRDPQGRTALQNAERLGFTEIAELIRSR